MGAIQEQTPELGPFLVELRSESFWVSRTGTTGDDAGADMAARILTVPNGEVPALAAALAMGIERGPLGDGDANPGPGWTVSRGDEAISIAGPWAMVSLDRWQDVDAGIDDYERVAGEVDYVNAPALLAALQV